MIEYEEVYCEVHGTVHDRDENPYSHPDGPECKPSDWRRVWIGAVIGLALMLSTPAAAQPPHVETVNGHLRAYGFCPIPEADDYGVIVAYADERVEAFGAKPPSDQGDPWRAVVPTHVCVAFRLQTVAFRDGVEIARSAPSGWMAALPDLNRDGLVSVNDFSIMSDGIGDVYDEDDYYECLKPWFGRHLQPSMRGGSLTCEN